MKRIIATFFIILLSAFFFEAWSQCPMCKMAAETNLENGGTMGKGLNKGILYMFLMPYTMVFVLGFIWYKNKKTYIDEDDRFGEDQFELN